MNSKIAVEIHNYKLLIITIIILKLFYRVVV